MVALEEAVRLYTCFLENDKLSVDYTFLYGSQLYLMFTTWLGKVTRQESSHALLPCNSKEAGPSLNLSFSPRVKESHSQRGSQYPAMYWINENTLENGI